MRFKNRSGVTLIILCIMIIVLIIITSITFLESTKQLQIKSVNNLYSDIETLNTETSQYYLTNETLPTKGEYCRNKAELEIKLRNFNINQNDSGAYYVLDLSKLDNLTLNYGREYKNWTSASDKYEDIYVINEVSHQIYYIKGIKLNGEMYYTSPTYK